MGEIVNLNRARKAKAKADDRATAAENRAAHGRTREERRKAEAERQVRDRALEGARIEPPPSPEPSRKG